MKDLTRRAKRILAHLAPHEARTRGHKQVHDEHVLLSMTARENRDFFHETIVATIFNQYSVRVDRLWSGLDNQLRTNMQYDAGPGRLLRPLEQRAHSEAAQLSDSVVGTEHILLALLHDSTKTIATSLAPYGLTYRALRGVLARRPGI